MLDVAVLVLAVRHFGERQVRDGGESFCRALPRPPSPPPPSPACRSLNSLTSAISLLAAASSFFALAWPISFEAAFRRACACSNFVDRGAAALVDREQVPDENCLRDVVVERPTAQRLIECGSVLSDPTNVVHVTRRAVPVAKAANS